jgi:hypothetical protein
MWLVGAENIVQLKVRVAYMRKVIRLISIPEDTYAGANASRAMLSGISTS